MSLGFAQEMLLANKAQFYKIEDTSNLKLTELREKHFSIQSHTQWAVGYLEEFESTHPQPVVLHPFREHLGISFLATCRMALWLF